VFIFCFIQRTHKTWTKCSKSPRLVTRTKESLELASDTGHPVVMDAVVRGQGDLSSPWFNTLQGSPVPSSRGLGFERLQGPRDPKGGELSRSTTKPRETVVEVGRCSDVQIV